MKDFIHQNKKVLSLTLLVLLIICTVVLRYLDGFIKTGAAPNGIVSFELAKTLPQSQAIMASWDEQAKTFAGLSLGFDFLYIFVYTGFLALLLYLSLQKLSKDKLLYKIGYALFYLIFLAGLADITENTALIKLLSGQHQAILSSLAYGAASLKFSIIVLVIFFLIINWSDTFLAKKK